MEQNIMIIVWWTIPANKPSKWPTSVMASEITDNSIVCSTVFRLLTKKASKLCVTGPWWGESIVDPCIPSWRPVAARVISPRLLWWPLAESPYYIYDNFAVGYRNWSRYGLRWSGWYCYLAQHELCWPSHGGLRPRRVLCQIAVPTTTAQTVWVVNFYSTTIIVFKKARQTCVFDVLYPCLSPSAFLWRRDSYWSWNQQAMYHERNGEPWFHPQSCLAM